MIIELANKVVKIGPTNYFVQEDDNPSEIQVIIPRELLTLKTKNSKVFLITKLNKNEKIENELQYYYENEQFAYYSYNLTKEQTKESGELKIQIKIIKELPENTEDNEEIDEGILFPMTYEQNGVWFSLPNTLKIIESI